MRMISSLHEAQPLGAVPAVAVPQQNGLRGVAGGDHFGLEELRQRGAENILAARCFSASASTRAVIRRSIETVVCFRAGLRSRDCPCPIRITDGACAVTGHIG